MWAYTSMSCYQHEGMYWVQNNYYTLNRIICSPANSTPCRCWQQLDIGSRGITQYKTRTVAPSSFSNHVQDTARGPGPAREPISSGPRDVPKLFNGNRPAAYAIVITTKLFTTSSPKENVINNIHFFWQRSLERTMDYGYWLAIHRPINIWRSFIPFVIRRSNAR